MSAQPLHSEPPSSPSDADPAATIASQRARLAQVTAAALAVSSAEGPKVFEQLARSLAELLDVDAALIGPPGVLIFRILNNRGIFANEASNWLKQGKTASEWKPAGINPTREAIADIRKTRQFLAKNRLGETPVYGVVVFTVEPPYTQLMAKAPTVPITNLSLLYTNLQDNYLAQTRIDPAHVTAIVRLLFGD